MSKSQNSLQTNSELKNEISIYKGELTKQCLIDNIVIIKKAFPSLPIGFYDVFTDRLKANGFNDDRLRDAVNYVIDTCLYPIPTIANFIRFDKGYKIYTYEEMLNLSEKDPDIWKQYKSFKPEGERKAVFIPIKL